MYCEISYSTSCDLSSPLTHLFEEVAGKGENVEEGRISKRRGDLPMFGQGMRRVRLSEGGRKKEICVSK